MLKNFVGSVANSFDQRVSVKMENELFEVVKSKSCVRDGGRGWGMEEEAVRNSASDASNLPSLLSTQVAFGFHPTTTCSPP
jgi:hypothetical protein